MSITPTALSALAPKAINWSIALSILLIVAGLFAICIPSVSGIAITLIFGWLMVISGLTHFLFAFKTHTTGSLIWELLIGAVYIFTGIYLVLHPLDALFALTLILACYLFFEAIVEFIQFFQLRPRHGAGWLIVDGIVTLFLAIMIWYSWPASSVWVIGTLVGISMVFSGFSRLMLSLAAKRALKTI
ncbi:MAG: HdeD family acid-resistance protein [Edaphobacter sp.]